MSAPFRLARLGALLMLAVFLCPAAGAREVPERLDAAGLRSLVAAACAAGAVTVVNYWATWCGPCREEIPRLRQLRRAYPEDRLFLLGVSVDLDEAAYRALVRSRPLGYPTAFGGEKLMEALDVRAIPRTEIFGPDGTLRKVFDGVPDADALRREVESLLPRAGGDRP